MMARNPFQGDDVDPFSGVRDEETGETAYKGPSNADIERLEKMAFASTDGQIDERDRREMAMTKTRLAKPAAKAPIVTKEQMKKAGFDNLRDYLNAQKELTRRGSPASKETKPKFSKVDPDIGKGPSSKEIDDLERRAAISQVSMAGGKPNFGISQGRQVDPKVLNSMKRAGGMKAGGAVKSASKRADGCAQRGKTKGRMV